MGRRETSDVYVRCVRQESIPPEHDHEAHTLAFSILRIRFEIQSECALTASPDLRLSNPTLHLISALMTTPARGAFIVIEGLDRSGKSTQAARLFDRIQSVGTDAPSSGSPPKAVLLKFPGQYPPLCFCIFFVRVTFL